MFDGGRIPAGLDLGKHLGFEFRGVRLAAQVGQFEWVDLEVKHHGRVGLAIDVLEAILSQDGAGRKHALDHELDNDFVWPAVLVSAQESGEAVAVGGSMTSGGLPSEDGVGRDDSANTSWVRECCGDGVEQITRSSSMSGIRSFQSASDEVSLTKRCHTRSYD